MAKFFYSAKRKRLGAHLHSPDGSEDLPTNDIDEAAKMIARRVVQFDIGDVGDELTVYQVETSKQVTIDKNLLSLNPSGIHKIAAFQFWGVDKELNPYYNVNELIKGVSFLWRQTKLTKYRE